MGELVDTRSARAQAADGSKPYGGKHKCQRCGRRRPINTLVKVETPRGLKKLCSLCRMPFLAEARGRRQRVKPLDVWPFERENQRLASR
jgi:transcription elongation factor Elf1